MSSSGTFTGHRAYAHGEDLRGLDWNVYARTGDFFLKVLEEEQRRTLDLLLDVSPSMTAGAAPRFDGARRLVALLGGVALARLDGVNLVAADRVHALRSGASIDALFDLLDGLGVEPGAASDPVRTWAERGLRGRVFWISDFATVEEMSRGLALLGRARRVSCGLLPQIEEDEVPEVDGYVEVRDPETAETFRVQVDPPLRRAIELELRVLRRRQDLAFRQAGVPLLRQRVPPPLERRARAWTDGGWAAWI
jgi:uncharacterized protein (DUF58 family)